MDNDRESFSHSRQAGIVFGFLCILVGAVMALFLFWQAGRALLDPRFLNDSVGRWESLIRYRSEEWNLAGMEAPDRARVQRNQQTSQADGSGRQQNGQADDGSRQSVQEASRFVNQVGQQTLRPMVILIMIGILALLVRIAVGFMEIGVRLTRLATADGTAAESAVRKLIIEAARRDQP